MRCEKHQLPMGTSYCNLCAVEYETSEVEAVEAKRKALWYALVNSLQDNGYRLGEAQIMADVTMDTATKDNRISVTGWNPSIFDTRYKPI